MAGLKSEQLVKQGKVHFKNLCNLPGPGWELSPQDTTKWANRGFRAPLFKETHPHLRPFNMMRRRPDPTPPRVASGSPNATPHLLRPRSRLT